ncbi:MAG: hypothetical protein M1821_005631 [Bathelium mastoideum]|nr:MAG: hypothetical protein M1821_005631 [Bathelium mastoideum]KAI9680444.1 MAG: hypothetical protein M1822_007202 [Bathelium mastoideum]
MATDAVEVVKQVLASTTNLEAMAKVVTPDATYVSVAFDNPELKKVLPWVGTHPEAGPAAICSTFGGVGRFWEIKEFQPQTFFGSGEDVAVFGSMTYTSRTIGKTMTSPFGIHAKVQNGKLTYMMFLEDSFATAGSFRSGGSWTVRSDPEGGEVVVQY